MAKLYDCFIFFNEFDLLEIRLNEMSPITDTFVLVEADKTFRGNDKPFYMDTPRGQEIIAQFGDKLRIVRVELTPDSNPWELEKQNRNAIMLGLPDCKPEDYIIISDLDEIPRATAVKSVMEQQIPRAFLDMGFYYYKFNLQHPYFWKHAKVLRFDQIDQSINDLRLSFEAFVEVPEGGWHFSKCFPKQNIIELIQAFSHSEYDNPEDLLKLDEYIEKGLHHGNKTQVFSKVPMDRHPEWFLANIERFKDLIA